MAGMEERVGDGEVGVGGSLARVVDDGARTVYLEPLKKNICANNRRLRYQAGKMRCTIRKGRMCTRKERPSKILGGCGMSGQLDWKSVFSWSGFFWTIDPGSTR